MNLAVIGTGYVGLVSGACFAETGQTVISADINEGKIDALRKGRMPFYEPGLEDIVRKNSQAGRLSFTTSTEEAVRASDVVFIAVDTPPQGNGQADLSRVMQVAQDIAKGINGYKVIVNISTVPVGTVERIGRVIEKNLVGDYPFDIVSNPEFLREGSAVSDRLCPSRIVIGSDSQKAIQILKEVYGFIDVPIITTTIRTAEMIKYASNAFLATKISFINEIAHICELVDADVVEVAEGMGYDPRIGSQFLGAGVGYGGSCFPKDTKALDHIAASQGHNFVLLKAVIDVNNMQRVRLVHKVKEALGDLDGRTIGIWGLSFKPDTDDIREAASIDIINYLQHYGARIKAYDPVAMDNARTALNNVDFCPDSYEACRDSDALVIVTEWQEFKEADLNRVKSLLARPVIVDGRNIFALSLMEELGFDYYSIGRQVVKKDQEV